MAFEKIYKALDEVLKSGQAAVDIAALKQFMQAVERDVPLDRKRGLDALLTLTP